MYVLMNLTDTNDIRKVVALHGNSHPAEEAHSQLPLRGDLYLLQHGKREVVVERVELPDLVYEPA